MAIENSVKQYPLKNTYLGWFHRYPARFSHDVLELIFGKVIERLGRIPINVLDPFAGSGSTLAFSKQCGIPSYGKELTPLGVLICEVRLNPPSDLIHVLKVAEAIANETGKGNPNKVNATLKTWIGEKNAARVDFMVSKFNRIRDIRLRNWLYLNLSSSLRPSSKWLAGSIKPQFDYNRDFSDVRVHFLRSAKILKRNCEKESQFFKQRCKAAIIAGDSKYLELRNRSIDAIISSPPYGSMYDYFDVHRLTYLAFGWNIYHEMQIGRYSKISKDGVGFKPPPSMEKWYFRYYKAEDLMEGRALRAYLQDMEEHFKDAYRVLRRDGIVAYAIANSMRNGKTYPLSLALAELLEKTGFKQIDIKPRKQTSKRILPAGRNPITGRFDAESRRMIKEFIIYARK